MTRNYLYPYKVLERRNKVDYYVVVPIGQSLYYANTLKRYFSQAIVKVAHVIDEVSVSTEETYPRGLVEMKDDEDFVSCPNVSPTENSIASACVNVDPSIGWDKRASVGEFVYSFPDVFSAVPGCTDTLWHDIILTTTSWIKAKNYPVSIHLCPHFL